MNIVEAAVGHDQDHVAGGGGLREMVNDLIGVREEARRFAAAVEFAHQVLRGKALGLGDVVEPGRPADTDHVGAFEGGGVDRLEHLAHARVGARLEDGDDAAAGEGGLHRRDRLAHGCGVVGEIVHHDDAPLFPADLLPAPDPLERLQGAG